MGSTGPAVPWGMLAPGYSQTHAQRPVTARSLFDHGVQGMAPGEKGGQCALGWSWSAWQKQQRVVLQCVLQHQVAALQGFKPAVSHELNQVAFFSAGIDGMRLTRTKPVRYVLV